jgi:hypothetical protein
LAKNGSDLTFNAVPNHGFFADSLPHRDSNLGRGFGAWHRQITHRQVSTVDAIAPLIHSLKLSAMLEPIAVG